MTFFIVVFILLMQFLWRMIDELVGKGLPLSIIGEFLMYACVGLVPLALPLAVLLSSLMTFGNMGEYFELTAAKASGISLQRLMSPIIVLVIFISIGAFFFSNNVVPYTNLKMRTLRYDVQHIRPEVSIQEGVFFKGIDGYSIRVEKKNTVTNMLYEIKIYDHSKSKGNLDITIADSGVMKMTADKRNMMITLWSGYKYTEVEEPKRKLDKTRPHQFMKFGEENILISLSGFELSRSKDKNFKGSYQMLDVSQLNNAIDSINSELETRHQFFKQDMMYNYFFKLNRISDKEADDAPVDNEDYDLVKNNRSDSVGILKRMRVAEYNMAIQRRDARRATQLPRQDLGQNISMTQINNSEKKDTTPAKVMPFKHFENFDSLFSSLRLESQLKYVSDAANTVVSNQYVANNYISTIDYERRSLRRHEIERHRKFTLSLACLIFLFIGAPLGAIIRKGGLGLPTVISTLMFILYYIVSLTGQKFVEESVLTSFEGMWLSSVILIIAGVFLTYQATNDSAILNLDTYLNWIREKSGLIRNTALDNKSHILGRFELDEIERTQLQTEFKTIGDLALMTADTLKKDSGWMKIAVKSYENEGYAYLLEFGVHYNAFLDMVILSQWFRIPYFEKRLGEFPGIDGKMTSEIFTRKWLRQLGVVIFPIALVRIIHLKIKVRILQRNIRQVVSLSSGMINLLNSSTFRNAVVSVQ